MLTGVMYKCQFAGGVVEMSESTAFGLVIDFRGALTRQSIPFDCRIDQAGKFLLPSMLHICLLLRGRQDRTLLGYPVAS